MKYLLPILLLFVMQSSFAQTTSDSTFIMGSILDENNKPIIHTTVLILKDNSSFGGSITDSNGIYEFIVPNTKETYSIKIYSKDYVDITIKNIQTHIGGAIIVNSLMNKFQRKGAKPREVIYNACSMGLPQNNKDEKD